MSIRKQLFSLMVTLLLAALPTAALALEVGEEAPDFTLESIKGETVSLSEFRGQTVFLKLATTWCPTCKQLSGEVASIGDYLKEKDVVFLEVFVQDSPAMVERYCAEKVMPMTHHALLDDGQAYKAYSVYLIPRMLVVDGRGMIQFDSAGQNVSADDLKGLVDGLQGEATES